MTTHHHFIAYRIIAPHCDGELYTVNARSASSSRPAASQQHSWHSGGTARLSAITVKIQWPQPHVPPTSLSTLGDRLLCSRPPSRRAFRPSSSLQAPPLQRPESQRSSLTTPQGSRRERGQGG